MGPWVFDLLALGMSQLVVMDVLSKEGGMEH